LFRNHAAPFHPNGAALSLDKCSIAPGTSDQSHHRLSSSRYDPNFDHGGSMQKLVRCLLFAGFAPAGAAAGLIVGLDQPFAGSNVVSRDTARTFQHFLASSHFADVTVPRTIVGLGFRLPGQANRSYPTVAINFSRYDLTLGKPSPASINANTLASDVFADNMVESVLFRSGAMTMPAEALTDFNTGPGVAPAGHVSAEYSWFIRAQTHYRLVPGDALVVLGRHSGHGNANGVPQTAWNFDGFSHPFGARIHTTSADATSSNSSTVNNVIKWLLVGQSRWTAGDGVVSDPANWRDASPPASGDEWLIDDDQLPVRTITLDSPISVGRIEIRDPQGLTLSGDSLLTLDSPGFETSVEADAGPVNLMSPVRATRPLHLEAAFDLTIHQHLDATSWRVRKSGPADVNAASVDAAVLFVESGVLRLTDPAVASRIGSISINPPTTGSTPTPGGTLDLAEAQAILDYAGTSPLGLLRTQVRDGRLMTSTQDRVIGYVEASTLPPGSTFFGQPLDADAILIASTVPGDANLDRTVEFLDLLAVAQSYGGPGSWSQGDFNHDAQIGFEDLLIFAQNYGYAAARVPGSDAFRADYTHARSLVPEPVCLMPLLSLALLGRRVR
jgi:hypothetical protein